MNKPLTIILLASCISLSYGSQSDNLQSFSAATQIEELTEWSHSTVTNLGSGLWNGNGFSFNLQQSEWLAPPVSTPNAGTALADQVFLNSITVKTRSTGQAAVTNCYAYLCSISGSNMAVINMSDVFNIPATNNTTFTFNFSRPSIVDSNTTYGILFSQNGSFASGSSITLGDGVRVGMARTNTLNTASSAGQLFNSISIAPAENYSPYVSINTSQIPEPASAILMVLGGLGFSVRRRRF